MHSGSGIVCFYFIGIHVNIRKGDKLIEEKGKYAIEKGKGEKDKWME